jgi:hypothetical protein
MARRLILTVELRGKTNPKPRKTTSAQSESPPYLTRKEGRGRSPDLQKRPIPTTSIAAAAYNRRLR